MIKSADRYGPILGEIIEDDNPDDATERGSSFRDFLRFVAMRRSLMGAQEYEKLSSIGATEEIKSFFSDMADLKHNEYECLRRYESDGRIVSLDAKSPPSFANKKEEAAPPIFLTIEDACRFALRKVMNDYCLYLRLADLEEETVTKRLFLYLARIHKCSLNFVHNRMELMASLHELKDKADAAGMCAHYSDAQVA
jgi:hypothetical protein